MTQNVEAHRFEKSLEQIGVLHNFTRAHLKFGTLVCDYGEFIASQVVKKLYY